MLEAYCDTAFLATVAVLLGCCYFFLLHGNNIKTRSGYRLPPCPVRPWPLVGNAFNMGDDLRPQFKAWHRQFGDLFSIYFGNTLVVVVNGYSTMKELLVHNGATCSDRPGMFLNTAIGMGETGIVFTSGPVWKELRSTTHQILKEFGMGTDTLAERIRAEVNCYVNKLSKLQGVATDIQNITYVSVSNVICSIIVGRRFGHEDARFQGTVDSLSTVAKNARGAAAINFMPILEYLPGDLFRARLIRESMTNVKNLLVELVSEIESKQAAGCFSESENYTGNYVFSYRRKQQERVKSGKTTCLNDTNLIKNIVDLFAAGTETVSSTMLWCVLYILNTPGVQARIHEELDRELGLERLSTMEDQARLPYLNAVIKESQRLSSVVPFSVMHKTSEDVTIGDYVIPKGTSLIPNLDSVLHDPQIWGADAEKFNPERFLTSDGEVLHREEFIPYSIGGRICVGEALAKMELFLFMSSMFQRFEFVAEDPNNAPSLEPIIGFTAVPTPFKVKCMDRLKKQANVHCN